MSRVLLVHPGALGDIVLFGRLCESLRRHDPLASRKFVASGDIRLTLVANSSRGRLLQGLGVVDEAIDFDSLQMHEVFTDRPAADCKLPRLLDGHDVLISCFAAGDAAAERRLAELTGCRESCFLPTRPPADFGAHLLDLWLELLAAAAKGTGAKGTGSSAGRLADVPVPAVLPVANLGDGHGATSDAPRQSSSFAAWPVPRAWRSAARDALGGLSRPIIIHPGSGGVAKCWPRERFIELAVRLGGADRVVFIVGPAEVERWDEAAVAELSRAGRVIREPSLDLLAGLLAQCRAYVGNDSGVSHLAAAVGAPSVVLFGPSSATHFRPLGPNVTVIQRQTMAEIDVPTVLGICELSSCG